MAAKPTARALAITLVFAAVAAACGNASNDTKSTTTKSGGGTATTFNGTDFTKKVKVDAPGVTDSEIHVGAITTTTNPLGANDGLLIDGIEGYFSTINAKGGIYGRQIKVTSKRDDQFTQNQAEAQGLVTQDNVYAAFVANAGLFTGAKVLAKAGIPTFGWNINPEWAGPANFFPNVAPPCFEKCALYPHSGPFVAKQANAHKVAILGYSVAPSQKCVDGNKQNFAKLGDAVGAKVVYADATLAFGQTDFAPQVSKMKDLGVDFLTTCVDFNGDFAIAKEMARQGLTDKITFMHANLYNPPFVKANKAAFANSIIFAQVDAVENKPAIPAVQEYLDYAAAHPKMEVSEITMQGWIAARQFVDALKATGPEFTWANFLAAWNQQKSYTAGGWVAPIDWTKQHHDPAEGDQYRSDFECMNLLKVAADGSLVAAYAPDQSKPWSCWDGHKPDTWSEPIWASMDHGDKPFTFADLAAGK